MAGDYPNKDNLPLVSLQVTARGSHTLHASNRILRDFKIGNEPDVLEEKVLCFSK